jgi:hypothetical protein
MAPWGPLRAARPVVRSVFSIPGAGLIARQSPEEGIQVMKSIRRHASLFVTGLALAGLLFLVVPKAAAQQDAPPIVGDADDNFNPPPCDFSDQFYADNGIDVTQLVLRFGDNGGTTRLTGPPARGNQKNYVADASCAAKDPTRRNFRILATTGGNADDGNSPFTNNTPETVEFISILAFVTNQSNFETSYSRTVGAAGTGGGTTISITNSQNPRGIAMQDIVGNFEAYAAVKQILPNGQFAGNPCNADMQSPLAPPTPCFDLSTVNSVFTPNLRQDWRFATNRNAMDGSDNNCISTDPAVCPNGVSDSPFGYFCDDLLGMWIITYFWFTQPPNTTDPVCAPIFKAIGAKNGFNLDGTPIILTANELNNQLEANGCGAEGKEAVDGSDGGAVWLVCPAIPDPRAGAIAKDAFLDQVHRPNGVPLDFNLTIDFLSLQIFGVFPNELTASQKSQLNSAVSSATAAN